MNIQWAPSFLQAPPSPSDWCSKLFIFCYIWFLCAFFKDDEAITVQRCTTIVGSAVYCQVQLPLIILNSINSLIKRIWLNVQGYLVTSTLSGDKLEDVGTFLKWNQILEMSVRRTLSNLIIWRQVFPPGSCSSSTRSFIAVVGTVFNSSIFFTCASYCVSYWRILHIIADVSFLQGHVLLVALLECGEAASITQP